MVDRRSSFPMNNNQTRCGEVGNVPQVDGTLENALVREDLSNGNSGDLGMFSKDICLASRPIL